MMPGLRFIIIALTIWAFFNTVTAGIIYTILCSILLAYVVVLQVVGSKSDIRDDKYSTDDNLLFKRYNVFFRFPITSRVTSAQLATIQVTVLVIIVLSILNSLYVLAVVGLPLLIGASIMAPKTNPQLYLTNVMKKGNVEAEMELEAVNDLLQRLHNIPEEIAEASTTKTE